MNVSEITLKRLNSLRPPNKNNDETQEGGQAKTEPVTDVSGFFSNLNGGGDFFLGNKPSHDDQGFKSDSVSIYDAVTLFQLFKAAKANLTQSQVEAFSGIEAVNGYISSMNCSCQGKLNRINEYYRDFVLGNKDNDLFASIKSGAGVSEIIFFYENQQILT
jgi:hypothetical protein